MWWCLSQTALVTASLTLLHTCHQHLQHFAGAHADLWRQGASCRHWPHSVAHAKTRVLLPQVDVLANATEQTLSCRLGMKGMDAFMDTSDLVDDADLEGQPSGLQPVRSCGQQEAAKLLLNMEGGLHQRCL